MLQGRTSQRIKQKNNGKTRTNKIIKAEEAKSCICQYGSRRCGLNSECFCARSLLNSLCEEKV
jgi:hypothetical protein